ncbi:MAG: hypothetical protein HY721_12835 [Planctomycetes bacterium]|nr:hypothetical protein [Planctomycetota bacterium]
MRTLISKTLHICLLLTAGGLLRAENVITMGYGEGKPGDRDIDVIVTATNDVAIHGYSLAFAYPASAITCTSISTEGTHVSSLVASPELVAPTIDDQLGVGVLGVIFDFSEPFEGKAYPATGAGDCPRIIARLTFAVKADAQGGVYPLRLVDGIGKPASFNRFSEAGQSIAPRLVHGSFAVVQGGNVLSLDRKIAFAGATSSLAIFAYARHPLPLDGFQVAFTYDKRALALPDRDTGTPGLQNATTAGTDLGFLLRPTQIEAFNFDVDLSFSPTLARASCAVLFDFAPPFDGQKLLAAPEAPGQTIVKYTFSVDAAADDERQWQDLDLEQTGIPGAVDNRFIVGDASLDPRLVDGKIYFSQGNLTGRVIDCVSREGVQGVKVATDPDSGVAPVLTGPNGAFRMDGMIPGKYTLTLSKSPGYYTSRHAKTETGKDIVVAGLGADDSVGALTIYKVPEGQSLTRPFVRGNVNGDARTDLSDAVYVLQHLFQGGRAPACMLAADINDDNRLDISDTIYMLSYLFVGGKAPPPPFCLNRACCGDDPTLTERLDCKEFTCVQ